MGTGSPAPPPDPMMTISTFRTRLVATPLVRETVVGGGMPRGKAGAPDLTKSWAPGTAYRRRCDITRN
jgi:hypothetical protein